MSELAQAQTTFRDSWTIRQATAFLLFGTPDRKLPDRHEAAEDIAFAEISARRAGKEYHRLPPFDRKPLKPDVDHLAEQMSDLRGEGSPELLKRAAGRCLLKTLLHRAEESLIGDLRARQIVAVGRPESKFSPGKPMRSEHQEIPHLALLGHITLNSILEPPSESWLVVRDPALPGPEKIWRDVRIPPEELRYLHPVALIEHWREGWEQRDATLGSGRPEIGGRTPATSCPTEDGADWRIPYTPKFLAAWFEDVRVPGWKGRSPPSAADCYAEAQKYFKDPIPRDPFREIRKGSTPPDWRKPGPRGPR